MLTAEEIAEMVAVSAWQRALADDAALQARGVDLEPRHLPGKHDQKSHGRKGPKGLAKAAAEKAAEAVAKAAKPAKEAPAAPKKPAAAKKAPAKKAPAKKAAPAAKVPPGKAAIPATGNARLYHRNLNNVADLAHTVEAGAITEERRLAGGAIGDTRLRRYADGTAIVWKRGGEHGDPRESDAEQLASLTARAFGLPAPRVYRNELDAVSMEFVDHATPAIENRKVVAAGFAPAEFVDSDEGRMMGLLDQLIENRDRHTGNWMVTDAGRMVPIDHGYAFMGNHRPGAGRKTTQIGSPFAQHYRGRLRPGMKETPWASNDLTAGDVAVLKERLQALRPDFEHIGRERWHNFMMERLDEIGKNATGTKSRLLPSLVD